MSKKVLILSASAGAGHLRAAQAIERAFAETGSAQSVHNHDTLEFTNAMFRHVYSKAYIEMVNRMPEVLGWLYDKMDQPDQDDRLQLAFDKLNTGPLIKLLKDLQPDITICTHFLPAEIISWLIGKGQLSTRQAIVVTESSRGSLAKGSSRPGKPLSSPNRRQGLGTRRTRGSTGRRPQASTDRRSSDREAGPSPAAAKECALVDESGRRQI